MNKFWKCVRRVAYITFFVSTASFWVIVVIANKNNIDSRACVVVSPNVTLIPAKPNSVTILRNGRREVCYIYTDYPRGKENALPNKSP